MGVRVDAVATAGAGVVRRGLRNRGVHKDARLACLAAGDGQRVSAVYRSVTQRGDGPGQGRPGDGQAVCGAGERMRNCASVSSTCSRASFIGQCVRCLAITKQKELLETNRVLAHSIRLRNPYVDPMHLIQVDMLRRKRAGEDTPEVNRAIAATISGISAGLRNTG